MPQFKPYWWINLISWMLTLLIIITRYHHAISFPATLRIFITRVIILFQSLYYHKYNKLSFINIRDNYIYAW